MARPLSKFGDYFLIKKVATGGMAEIYLARTRTAQGPEKYVALKMIHPRYMEDANFHNMIVAEATIAVQLNHRNIGQVFDLGQVEGRYFLVMEFIDGYDLSRLQEAARQRELQSPIDVTAYIGREVCAALDYAHGLHNDNGQALNLIHRDISPQNILVGFDGEVKIIDFGIAKVSTQLQQTQVGVIKGKFYYMSPEQAGAQDVDQRSDLFSLGICLWETLTGRSLFRREGGPTNPLAILHEIRSMPIPRVRELRPDCPPELDQIVAKALARDLDARWTSAAELEHALADFLESYAPHFEPARAKAHMVAAFDKEAMTKETKPSPDDAARPMRRGDFQPSRASVIFELPTGRIDTSGSGHDIQAAATGLLVAPSAPPDPQAAATGLIQMPRLQYAPHGVVEDPQVIHADATNILSVHERPIVRDHAAPEVIAGIASGDVLSRTTDRRLRQVSDQDLPMSKTVFLLKDDVEEMKRAGAAPVVRGNTDPKAHPAVDPNDATQTLDTAAIQAAHAAYNARLHPALPPDPEPRPDNDPSPEPAYEPKDTPNLHGASELPLPPISRHPLFRALVIAVLVLCVLGATLTLLLVRRTRAQHRAALERERVVQPAEPTRPPSRSPTH